MQLRFLDEEPDNVTVLVTLEAQPLPYCPFRSLVLTTHRFVSAFYLIARFSWQTHGISSFLEDFDNWAVGTTCWASSAEFFERYTDLRTEDSPVQANGATRMLLA